MGDEALLFRKAEANVDYVRRSKKKTVSYRYHAFIRLVEADWRGFCADDLQVRVAAAQLNACEIRNSGLPPEQVNRPAVALCRAGE